MPSDAIDQDALHAFADQLKLADRLEPFNAHRWSSATPDRPVLHLEDVSAIPFLSEIDRVEEYQHRARVRATTGHLYATVTPPDPAYDQYCADTLHIGRPEWIDVRAADDPLAVTRGCLDKRPFQRLATAAREVHGLTIHPYMSIEDVWVLAERLSDESGSNVAVVGPPPPVTWIANDKALFTELVTLVLGNGWTTETHVTQEPARLVELLGEMAQRHAHVGLKRTRCASAMGNLVLHAPDMDDAGPDGVRTTVTDFLAGTEWPGDEPVLVVAWEDAVSSPSTQWWMPPVEVGPPQLDGIYEQILEGDRKVFVGSRLSQLPTRVHAPLTLAAGQVAAALQFLGYVDRCSFDHLIVGDLDGEFVIRFTECNGRWGGTSTPMHLVDRVVTGPRPPYRAQDFSHPRLAELGFEEILSRAGPAVFDTGRQTGRFIFYNVGPLPDHGKMDVIALGATQAEAERAMLAELPRALGL